MYIHGSAMPISSLLVRVCVCVRSGLAVGIYILCGTSLHESCEFFALVFFVVCFKTHCIDVGHTTYKNYDRMSTELTIHDQQLRKTTNAQSCY